MVHPAPRAESSASWAELGSPGSALALRVDQPPNAVAGDLPDAATRTGRFSPSTSRPDGADPPLPKRSEPPGPSLLRGALLDLLATGIRRRTTPAVRRHGSLLRREVLARHRANSLQRASGGYTPAVSQATQTEVGGGDRAAHTQAAATNPSTLQHISI